MVDGATLDDLKCILVDVMVLYGDLTQESVASKLITFGDDGVSVFQGVITNVIVRLKDQTTPFHDWCALFESSHKFGSENTL